MLKALLPRGKKPRRVLFGPARGAILPLDLQYELRLYLGVYERELWPAYRSLLKPGMTAFDIGGRDGYSAALIHSLTGASVTSFEADATWAQEMALALKPNGPALRAVHAFVGASGLSLDAASAQYGFPGFVKIDVEGGEADVLRSGPETLKRRPAMIVEVHNVPVEQECRAILRDAGYTIATVNQVRFFKEQRPSAHNRWLACHAR